MAPKATKTDGRVCSHCRKPGHNARTCEIKKRADAREAKGAETPALPPASSSMVHAPVAQPSRPASSGVLVSGLPSEFEEWTKQAHVISASNPKIETLIRATFATYPGAPADVNLSIQRSDTRPVLMTLEMDVVAKVHEVLTAILQKDAARTSQKLLKPTSTTAHVNGASAS